MLHCTCGGEIRRWEIPRLRSSWWFLTDAPHPFLTLRFYWQYRKMDVTTTSNGHTNGHISDSV